MLVPAMTFAWWLVSMSAPGHHAHHHGATHDTAGAAGPLAELAGDHDTDDAVAVDNPYDVQPAKTDEAESAEPAVAENGGDDPNGAPWERVALKVVTPAIVRSARTYLDLPMGAERTEIIDGVRYVFVLERHYHPPGFVGGPHGWHKGVTVYGVR